MRNGITTFLAAVVLGSIAALGGHSLTTSAYTLCDPGSGICGGHWSPATIHYHDSTGWTGAKHDAITASAQTWYNTPTPLYIYYDSSPTGPYEAYVALAPFDNMYPALTWTYYNGSTVVAAATLLNSTWSWNTTQYMNLSTHSADVRTVTTHEMGHWMFLGHPCPPSHYEAVMCPNGVAKWYLTSDDLAGIEALYHW